MSNPFKVGDKITVIEKTCVTVSTTEGKAYTVLHVGKGHGQLGGESAQDVQFVNDVGRTLIAHCYRLALFKE